jgi:hypothetical protein
MSLLKDVKHFATLSSFCIWTCKLFLTLAGSLTTVVDVIKFAWRGLSALQLIELIVPYPWRSSLIHLQRHHRTKRRESPLLAKKGTFIEGILLTIRNLPQFLVSFTCRKVGTWNRLFIFPSGGRHAEDFLRRKNPTASAGFELANSGTSCNLLDIFINESNCYWQQDLSLRRHFILCFLR